MLIQFVLFLVITVSFIHAGREKLICTLSISRSTENSDDHEFFLHIETFLLQHETAEVLSGFLDKGNLTVGIRYIISDENKIKLDYLYLKLESSNSNKHFLASAMHDMDKKKFLTSVKNALYKAYFDADSKEKSKENFDTMMEDKVIGSYLKKIKTRPLIMYTEMSITSVGIDLNLIEISSADNDTCFLTYHRKEETEANYEATNSNDYDKMQLKPRSFDESEDSDETNVSDEETGSPCIDKKKSHKKKKKSPKKKNISQKRVNIIKEESESTDETDDTDEEDKTNIECSDKKVSKKQKSNKQKPKKRKLNVKYDTEDDKCNSNKKEIKQKTPCKGKTNKTKKRKIGIKFKSESQSNSEMEETEAVDEEEESNGFQPRSIKNSTSSTDSKLFQLLVNEINKSDINKNDNNENTENEYTEVEKEVKIQKRPSTSVKRKSVSRKNKVNNKSAKKRNHLDIETRKHIIEHVIDDDDEDEKHHLFETDNEEESDTSKADENNEIEIDEEDHEKHKQMNTGRKIELKPRSLGKKNKSCDKTCCSCDDN